MKILKVGNKSYIMKFTTKQIHMMNKEGVTVKTMSEALSDNFDTSLFNRAFYYSLKAGQPNVDEDKAFEILDELIEEGKNGEELQMEILEELMSAQGFGEQFKQMKKNAKKKAKQ